MGAAMQRISCKPSPPVWLPPPPAGSAGTYAMCASLFGGDAVDLRYIRGAAMLARALPPPYVLRIAAPTTTAHSAAVQRLLLVLPNVQVIECVGSHERDQTGLRSGDGTLEATLLRFLLLDDPRLVVAVTVDLDVSDGKKSVKDFLRLVVSAACASTTLRLHPPGEPVCTSAGVGTEATGTISCCASLLFKGGTTHWWATRFRQGLLVECRAPSAD